MDSSFPFSLYGRYPGQELFPPPGSLQDNAGSANAFPPVSGQAHGQSITHTTSGLLNDRSEPATTRTRRSNLDWGAHKQEIQRLYIQDDWTLGKTMEFMRIHRGFEASEKQYKSQLKTWRMQKNLSREQAVWMVSKASKRKRDENKDTAFSIGGKGFSGEQAEASLKRMKHANVYTVIDKPTPSEISYSTPSGTNLGLALSEQHGESAVQSDPLPSISDTSEDEEDDGLPVLSLSYHGRSKSDLTAAFQAAKTFHSQGDLRNAARYFKQAHKGLCRVLSPTHEETVEVTREVANFFALQNNMPEADKVIDASVLAHIKRWGIHGDRTYQHVLDIVELLNAWHREADALAYLAHAKELAASESGGKDDGMNSDVFGWNEPTHRRQANLSEAANMLQVVEGYPASSQLDHATRVARTNASDRDDAARALLLATIRSCARQPIDLALQMLRARKDLLKIDGRLGPRVVLMEQFDFSFRGAIGCVDDLLSTYPWDKKRIKTLDVLEASLDLVVTLLDFGHRADADRLFNALANKADDVYGHSDKCTIWACISIGLVYQRVATWADSGPWFERALAGAVQVFDDEDSLVRSLEHAVEEKHFSYLGDEGRPYSTAFGVSGLHIYPTRLHIR